MDITKREKAASKNAGEIKAPKQIERFTLKRLLTKDESENHLVPFLKGLSSEKGPWAEYWDFYCKNMSGEVESMSEANRRFCEKIVKEVREKYAERKG